MAAIHCSPIAWKGQYADPSWKNAHQWSRYRNLSQLSNVMSITGNKSSPVSPNLVTPGFLNPKQVIRSAMLDLNIGPVGETVTSSSLSCDMFVGNLGQWTDFEKEVSDFYWDLESRKAFEPCENTKADLDLHSLVRDSPNFAALEHTQIGDERDLQGRFLSNVTNRVVSVLKFMLDKDYFPEQTLRMLMDMPLRADVHVGSAKAVPKKQRKQHEPDVVFKIPGTGDNQRVRLVGELKFPRTCRMSRFWGKVEYKTPNSMRHIFGQIGRDMRENGTRFGFFSTYDDTVFLKIAKQGGKYVLLYSEPLRHHNSVIEDGKGRPLSQIGVRLAMLYLLYRASHQDESHWHFDPSSILSDDWTLENARGDDGKQASPYKNSPFQSVRERIKKGYKDLSQAIRNRRPTASTSVTTECDATPFTPESDGPSSDDPTDKTYIDSGTPIRTSQPTFQTTSPASSSVESHTRVWNMRKAEDALYELRPDLRRR